MRRRIRHIIIGWAKKYGWLPTSKAEEKLSELRMAHCIKCPFSEESKVLKLLNGNVNYEREIYCTKCHCPCEQKSLVVDESCPMKKW
jgi:hypothetical protein